VNSVILFLLIYGRPSEDSRIPAHAMDRPGPWAHSALVGRGPGLLSGPVQDIEQFFIYAK
jgi:hypothetical protein